MPLVSNTKLPTFLRLKQEGQEILSHDRAKQQDIRALHIGLLNMMPDAALEATERQFFRLVGQSNPIAQYFMHPFSIPELARGKSARQHIDNYYESFEQVRDQGLDALIITGANVTNPELPLEPFWEPLSNIVEWALKNVTSTLCSCLATHACMQYLHGQPRIPRSRKLWGVFEHTIRMPEHPLVRNINTRFHVPHSRWNTITPEQFRAAALKILIEGVDSGVHLATSRDGFRLVFCQGHQEYDTISLLKEYQREINRFCSKEIYQYPVMPTNYFDPFLVAVLNEYRQHIENAVGAGTAIPEFPTDIVTKRLHNVWTDTGKAVVGNWMGLVYQLTHPDRDKPFMPGVNPDDPLGLATIGL